MDKELQCDIAGHFASLKRLNDTSPKARYESNADFCLVDLATKAMEAKLLASREKGRGGWWDDDRCSVDDLQQMLAEHLTKGDMVDVMNFAAMIYVRGIIAAGSGEDGQ